MKNTMFMSKAFKIEATITRCAFLLFSLFFVLFSSFASAKSQNILKFDFENSKIESIINYIETNSEYRFLYNPSDIEVDKKINFNYHGEVSKAITTLFKNTNVRPVIANKQVILKPQILAQERVISGIVKDEDGLPLEGVTVLINNFERGTSTDENGKYSITAKTGDTMLFTYIGFKDQKVTVGSENTVNIALIFDSALLEEVVLIGYGKRKRNRVSSAIGTIEGEDIENEIQSGTSFDRSLSGLVQGLRVTQGSGRPGTGVDINIRGYTSPFTGSANNPLFIIDGVPVQANTGFNVSNNPLSSINPNDIESLNVLKDAAATSIYGSRGANGVIIVKTKRGRKNQELQVNLSIKSTFARPINTLKYLDAEGFKKYSKSIVEGEFNRIFNKFSNSAPFTPKWFEAIGEAFLFRDFGVEVDMVNFPPQINYDPTGVYGNANTNWSDVVYRNAAFTQEYNASLTGGGEKTTYGLSLRHLNQEGLLKADEFKQYNARLNFSVSPNEKWDIGTNIGVSSSKNKSGYVALNQNLNLLLSARPDIPVYDEQGEITTYKGKFGFQYANPLGMTTKNHREIENKSVTGNIYVQHEILKGLKLKGALNVAHFSSEGGDFFSGKYATLGFSPNRLTRSLIATSSTNTNVVGDFTANYNKLFNEKHSLDLLAGVTKTREYSKIANAEYYGFLTDNLRLPQYAKSSSNPTVRTPSNGLNSYIVRASYDYDNRYNLTATARLDQATKFAPSKRDAWFPSVAASWNIHNEKFISNKDKINNLKLRLSYGLTGSSNVPSFTFVQKFIAGSLYVDGTTLGPSTTLSNPNAAWEKTSELNLGLDFGILQNRISGSVDVYKRRTNGALIASPFPLETGATAFTSNLATIDNKGIEAVLNFKIFDKEHFTWSLGVNATKNINELISFNKDFAPNSYDDIYEVGREINLVRGYIVEGIYQTPQEVSNSPTDLGVAPGDYKMKDVNNDGKITDEDRVILGSSQPDWFGGFNTKVTYNNFSLGATFSYSFGSEIARRSSAILEANPSTNIEAQFAPENRWSSSNTKATLPRIALFAQQNNRTSTANVFDASYIRLKGVRLGYRLPNQLTDRLNLAGVNFYLSGNNLYTWTDFPGVDPEAVAGGSASPISTENRDPYPLAKSFTLGVDIKF